MKKVPSQISFVVLYVKDLAVSKKFYSKTLGFPVKRTDDGYVEFDTQGVPLALMTFSAAEGLTGKKLVGLKSPPHFSLSLGEVPDVDKTYKQLKKAGVKFLKTPESQPWGQRTAHLLDPDGNLLEVYTWEKKEG